MKQTYNETVVRFARYGVSVDTWHTEPPSCLMSSMGWEDKEPVCIKHIVNKVW